MTLFHHPRLALTMAVGGLAIVPAALPGSATAAEATWQFAPALAPPPPPGVAPAPFPVALGSVGDIKFWAPNRGLLITAGTQRRGVGPGIVPMGVYAYDGVNWHQLSTVCGGTSGRIAWAGPDEFWTIADQRAAQATSSSANPSNTSLCHFKDGTVVGSYAMPFDQPDSYQSMDAAVCRTANDCWFAGGLATPPATGGFHLHWDGTDVTVVNSPQNQPISSLETIQGQVFESGGLPEGADGTSPPPLLHTIAVPGSATLFRDVSPSNPSCADRVICPPLPDYGVDANERSVDAGTLTPLMLSSDGGLSGTPSGAPQMWGIASPNGRVPRNDGIAGHTIALRLSGGRWTQVVPQLGAFSAGLDPIAVAAEPGQAAAWVSLFREGDLGPTTALVARISATGQITGPLELGPAQGVGGRGGAGPIDCPTANDCWMATDKGWLFHLTDGTVLPRDSDPNFAGVISFRPPDGGVPFAPPDAPPPDDSLLNQKPPELVTEPPEGQEPGPRQKTRRAKKAKPLVTHPSSPKLKKGTTIVKLSFTLTAKAHVQLVASRHGKVVARSARVVLKAGRHRLTAKLNPKRWPTNINIKATPFRAAKKKPAKKAPATRG